METVQVISRKCLHSGSSCCWPHCGARGAAIAIEKHCTQTFMRDAHNARLLPHRKSNNSLTTDFVYVYGKSEFLAYDPNSKHHITAHILNAIQIHTHTNT